MAAGTLYTYPQSFRANKVLIAAQYSGADVKVDAGFKLGETNKSADFLKKFPNGKVPAFEAKDGFTLTESNAIAHYVANSQLQGEDNKNAALVQQWISFSDNEILPAACTWVFPCLGVIQYNKQETDRAKDQIKKVLTILNNHLLTRTFVVGERVTLADISLVCNLQSLYETVLDTEFRKSYQNVNRYFVTMINQPQVKKVLGDVKLCEKMAQFDAKKYKELHGGGDNKKQEKKPAEKKPAQPKKEEPKEVEEEKPKEVVVDPFASLPKGTMDFDEFKRTYSNKPTYMNSVPYFWEHVDKSVYSLWYCEYAENTKGKMNFMVSNLAGGMLQRIEKLRKHAFARILMLGKNADHDSFGIAGLWLFRCKELAFKLSPDWQTDYESYSWRNIDLDSEEAKKLVPIFFHEEEKYNDREIYDEKVFK